MKQNNQNENQNQSKQILLSVLAIAILVVAVVGISFAAFTYSKSGTKENSITTGTIKMEYTEDSNGIEITDAMPTDDETGKSITKENAGKAGTTASRGVFEFTVTADLSGSTTISYEVAAEKVAVTKVEPSEGNQNIGTMQLPDSAVKLYLEKDEAGGTDYKAVDIPKTFTPAAGTVGAPSNSMVMDSGTFTTDQTNKYVLRMWVDSKYDMKNLIVGEGTPEQKQYKGQYKVKVNVYGKAAQ